jgi:Na+/glutamate symporter
MVVDPWIALRTGCTPMTGGHGNAAAFAPLPVAQGASAAMGSCNGFRNFRFDCRLH